MGITNAKKIYLMMVLIWAWSVVSASDSDNSSRSDSCPPDCHCYSDGSLSSDEDDAARNAFVFDIRDAVACAYPSLLPVDAATVFYNPVLASEKVDMLGRRFYTLQACIGGDFKPVNILMFLVENGSITPTEANEIKLCPPWRETCAAYIFRSRR
ncbi:MAG: hypothetical protein QG604_895 [Candidatus Dependentiae bacterium]|nr:hypothetical protein [Candidatus Dependentiae bacterium]